MLIAGAVSISKDEKLAFFDQLMQESIQIRTQSGADDAFELTGLNPGTYTVLAMPMPSDYTGRPELMSARVTLGDSEVKEVRLELR